MLTARGSRAGYRGPEAAVILAVDPGLATCGYAVVYPRTGGVVELGTLTTKPTAGVHESTDRTRRLRTQVAQLDAIARRNGCTTIAAEAMSFGGPGRFAMAISLCLSWGGLVGLAHALDAELLEVPPKTWQHALLGTDGTGRVDYEHVFAALSSFVGKQGDALAAIPEGQRNHALDAVGVGLFAAFRPTTAIRTATEVRA